MQHGTIRGKVFQRFLPLSTHTTFQRLLVFLLTDSKDSITCRFNRVNKENINVLFPIPGIVCTQLLSS